MKIKALFVLGFLILVILYPFWRLFSWVVNIIGVKGIRNTNGVVQTPVVFYEHPETKKQVVFVATIHVAEGEYFTQLQHFIELLVNHKVLFEGVGKLSQEEEKGLTEKELSVSRHFDYIFSLVSKMGEVMLLQHQKQGMVYSSDWINTDMRRLELVKLFAYHNIRILSKEKNLDHIFREESIQITRWFVNKLFSRFVSVVVVMSLLTFFSRKRRLVKKIIVEARNEEAMRGINTHLVESNVVTIWGVEHLRGIEKRLKKDGFRETRREWFTAYRIREYSLFQAIRSN